MKLVICEKKDQALAVANGLGIQSKNIPAEGTFNGEKYKILAAKGHLIGLKELRDVNKNMSWNDPNTLIPIPSKFPMGIIPDQPNVKARFQPRSYFKRISDALSDNPSEVIIATDSDREGEAIGQNILLLSKFKGNVKRAWLAAGLDRKSIQEAFLNLRPIENTYGLYMAAIARSRADWLYMSLVVAYTYFGRYSVFGKNLGQGSGRSSVISVGGVQTPALAMIVNLEDKIKNFVPVEHFKVKGIFKSANTTVTANYTPVVTEDIILSNPPGINWVPSTATPKENEPDPLDKPQFTDIKLVNHFIDRLKSAGDKSIVKSVKTRKKLDHPPKPYELSDAQAEISKKCNVSSMVAQEILEDLYLQKWLSYARTDERELPNNLYEPETLNDMLLAGSELPDLQSQAEEVLQIHTGTHKTIQKFKPKSYVSKDMPHWGLSPSKEKMTLSAFNALAPSSSKGKKSSKYGREELQQTYIIVLKRYLQAHYPPAEYSVQEIEFLIPTTDLLGNKNTIFKTKVETLVKPGWLDAFKEKSKENNQFIDLSKSSPIVLENASAHKEVTQKPKRYTLLKFPTAMQKIAKDVSDPKLKKLLKETKGIGTPATRSSIIQTLIDRGYIEVKKGTIYPTQKGSDLIHNVVPPWLKQPETRALWEDYLVNISNEKNPDTAIKMMQKFVNEEKDKIEKLISELIAKYSNNLGEKVTPTPAKVSAKMKNAIKNISEKKSISLPPGTLTNPVKAKAFLDKHLGGGKNKGESHAPSDAQKEFAQSLYKNLPSDIAEKTNMDEILKSSQSISSFIDKSLKYRPPSKKQKDLATKILSELPGFESPENTDEILKYESACKEFLDNHFSKVKQKNFQKG